MYWADRIAKEIINSEKYKPYWADDMKTPSGRIHVGSLRGVIIHDLIYKALLDAGKKVVFSYVIEDHDPMDSLPVYLDEDKYKPHMGKPLYTIPSPKTGYQNYAEYFAKDFIEVFNRLGAHPKIIWMSKVYKQGQMNGVVREVLDKVDLIRQIYEKMYQRPQPKNWYPFQVVCPKCGKLGTTKVYDWDGREVSFECLSNLVEWAKGCGFKGKISPLNGNGKIPWKVEWACKWKVIGITVEGAGKDHMSKGGSHDIAAAVCRKVINYSVPYPFSHEFFLIKGRKMSSSKGLGSSAREISKILPPEILRFLIVRTPYQRAINFDPGGNTIADLFDEYDRCAFQWWKEGRKNDFGRMFELSQIKTVPKQMFLPRFRNLALYLQMPNVNLRKMFSQEKGSPLIRAEEKILKERLKYARLWLDNYAPKEMKFAVQKKLPAQVKNLTKKQKQFLALMADLLKKDWPDAEKFQSAIYGVAKKTSLSSQDAFAAIYLVLIGKTHGPKAAWLILSQDRDFVRKRFQLKR